MFFPTLSLKEGLKIKRKILSGFEDFESAFKFNPVCISERLFLLKISAVRAFFGKAIFRKGLLLFLFFLLFCTFFFCFTWPAGAEETQSQKSTGQIRVLTVPNGSDIYIEDSYMGTTPALLTEVPVGYYELVLKGKGYDDSYEKVYVRAGKTTEIFRNLGVKKGVLSVLSEPSGASIYLDGRYMGKTPSVFEAEVGTHRLELKKSCYRKVSQEILLSYEEPLALEAKLHINLIFYVFGGLLLLFLVYFAKKHPDICRIQIPKSRSSLQKYESAPSLKTKLKKKILPNSKSEFRLESESESGKASEYLVELENLPKPEFKCRREGRNEGNLLNKLKKD